MRTKATLIPAAPATITFDDQVFHVIAWQIADGEVFYAYTLTEDCVPQKLPMGHGHGFELGAAKSGP